MPIPAEKKRSNAPDAVDFSSDAATPSAVLITGASSGFGEACARHLGIKGYRVYGTSRRATTAPDTHRDPSGTDSYQMIPMDVCDSASVDAGVDTILKDSGRIDVVVRNAGVGLAGSVEDSTAGTIPQRLGALLKRVLPGWLFEWLMMATYNRI